MSMSLFSVEWLDHNTERSYPLTEDSTKKDVSGSFLLPDSFLCGLSLSVSGAFNVEPAKFYLRTLVISENYISITIGYSASSGPKDVASAQITRSSFQRYTPYALSGIGDFYDAVGNVVIGELDAISLQPSGVFTFDIDGGQLETDTIRPQLRGISRLLVNNGDSVTVVTGDLELASGRNCRLVADESVSPKTIRIDFISGEGSIQDCDCGDDILSSPPIRYINDIPGINGHFYLEAGECIELESISNGIKINDKCASPCCTGEQKQELIAAIRQLEAKLRTVENFQASLGASVNQMEQTLSGTAIFDRGGESCES